MPGLRAALLTKYFAIGMTLIAIEITNDFDNRLTSPQDRHSGKLCLLVTTATD